MINVVENKIKKYHTMNSNYFYTLCCSRQFYAIILMEVYGCSRIIENDVEIDNLAKSNLITLDQLAKWFVAVKLVFDELLYLLGV